MFLLCIVVQVSLLLGASVLPAEVELLWQWSGAVTAHSAVVKVKLQRPQERGRLLFSTDPRLDRYAEASPSNSDDSVESGVWTFALSGLEPNRDYYYSIEVRGNSGPTGHFRTFPQGPSSFRFALGSCSSTGSNHPVYDVIRKLDPLFFIHMGDFHYEDIGVNDPARFRKAFDRSLTAPRQNQLWSSVPIAYIWDDHDYGPNDADRNSPSREAALQVYQEVVPHYPLVENLGQVESIEQAFAVGRVYFILTDGRSRRDPVEASDGPSKSMLGPDQREWLFRQFEYGSRNFPLVVWVNPVPWITTAEPGSDHGWEPFSHERRVIADQIKGWGLDRRLLMLSGDAHMVAVDDGTNSNYSGDSGPDERAFPVFHAAPIDRYARMKGGPYSHGTAARKRWFGLGRIQQFGLVEILDNGDNLTIGLTGYDGKGRQLQGLSLSLRCDSTGCVTVD